MAEEKDENNEDASFTDKETENEEIHQKMITPQDASKLKSQLFELCKQTDKDDNQLISYSEFESVIKKFLPTATDKQTHEMFNTMDTNNTGNISYAEFLSDSNFDRFLEYCGYFTYTAQSPIDNDGNNDISEYQKHLKKEFSVRNAHDKQIIITKQEEIDRLNDWINTEGKPAQYKVEQLEIEIEGFQQELSLDRIEIKTLSDQLSTIKEEQITLKSDYNYEMNNKNTELEKLKGQLKGIEEELKQTNKSLKTYENKEQEFNELKFENKNIFSENERLKNENNKLSERNIEFEKRNNLLNKQTSERMHEITKLNEEEDEYDEIVNDLKNELQNANDTIEERNGTIDDLREKLGFKNDENNSYKPHAMDMRHTIRMDDVNAMKSLKTERGGVDNLFSNSNTLRSDTMHGFHMDDHDQIDNEEFENNLIINAFGKSNTNVLSNDKEIEELNEKITEMNNNKINMENELKENNKKLNENQTKLIDTRNELNAIKKQFDELNVLNEMEMKGLNQKYMLKDIEIETVKREMDEQKDKYETRINDIQKQFIQNVTENDDDGDDENAPLITDIPPPNSGQIKNEYNPQCVCFSYSLW